MSVTSRVTKTVKRRRVKGSGSVFWSEAREQYMARATRPGGGRKTFLGPPGDDSPSARLGVGRRLDAYLIANPPAPRGTPNVSRLTNAQWVLRCLAEATLAPKTRSWYRWLYDSQVAGSTLDHLALGETEPKNVRAFFASLEKAGIGAPTRRGVHTLLARCFTQAVREDRLALSPMRAIRKPVHKPRKREPWSPDEVAAFLVAARDDRYYPLFLFMLTTTCGPAEAFGLQRQDLSLDEPAYALIRRNLAETDRTLQPVKNDYRARRIALPSTVAEVLRGWLDSHVSPFVFPSPEGGPMHRGNFARRIFRPLVTRAGVRPAQLYDLRHAANVLQGHVGVSIEIASRRMGHASIQQTVDTYGHYFAGDDTDAAEKQDRWLAAKGLSSEPA